MVSFTQADWTDAGSGQKAVTWTNLLPGEYTVLEMPAPGWTVKVVDPPTGKVTVAAARRQGRRRQHAPARPAGGHEGRGLAGHHPGRGRRARVQDLHRGPELPERGLQAGALHGGALPADAHMGQPPSPGTTRSRRRTRARPGPPPSRRTPSRSAPDSLVASATVTNRRNVGGLEVTKEVLWDGGPKTRRGVRHLHHRPRDPRTRPRARRSALTAGSSPGRTSSPATTPSRRRTPAPSGRRASTPPAGERPGERGDGPGEGHQQPPGWARSPSPRRELERRRAGHDPDLRDLHPAPRRGAPHRLPGRGLPGRTRDVDGPPPGQLRRHGAEPRRRLEREGRGLAAYRERIPDPAAASVTNTYSPTGKITAQKIVKWNGAGPPGPELRDLPRQDRRVGPTSWAARP